MRRFIIKFSLFILSVTVVVIYLSNRTEIIPFTGSVSFDSKIYELRKRGKSPIDNIAIGASITQHHLSSEILVDFLDGESYYNVSSWGQNIIEDFILLQEWIPIYHPKCVFLVSNCGDFSDGCAIERASDISLYLNGGTIPKLYLMTKYKLKHEFHDFDTEYADYSSDSCSYNSLSYDEWGGVPLFFNSESLLPELWNGCSNFKYASDIESYRILDSLCKYLRNSKVDLIFAISPARYSYYADNMNDVISHINCTQSIVNRYNHIFINELNYANYPDSLFSDCSHLNEHGAKVFTERIVEYLDSIGFKK